MLNNETIGKCFWNSHLDRILYALHKANEKELYDIAYKLFTDEVNSTKNKDVDWERIYEKIDPILNESTNPIDEGVLITLSIIITEKKQH